MKPGEKLVRRLIAELNERVAALEGSVARGSIGSHYWRYRMRWLRRDYERLAAVARRWGFDV